MKHTLNVETSMAINSTNSATLNPLPAPTTMHDPSPSFPLIPPVSTPVLQPSHQLSSSPTSIETTTPFKKTNNKGRAAGSKNYTDGNVDILLIIVEQIKPHGSIMWEKVTEEYNKQTQVR